MVSPDLLDTQHSPFILIGEGSVSMSRRKYDREFKEEAARLVI